MLSSMVPQNVGIKIPRFSAHFRKASALVSFSPLLPQFSMLDTCGRVWTQCILGLSEGGGLGRVPRHTGQDSSVVTGQGAGFVGVSCK